MMNLFERLKGSMRSGRETDSRALPASSPEQDELTAAFRRRLAESAAERTADTREDEWKANVNRLVDLALSEDPRNFLNWDIIRSTMFVAEEQYVDVELEYLMKTDAWGTRWQPAIQEWRAGNPQPFRSYSASSGNLIHHAYHVANFEHLTGCMINDFDIVFEYGGGYGSMRRLFMQLDFEGEYVIHDLPEFTALQDYFLRLGGMDADATQFTTDLNEFASLLTADANKRSLLLGTWSISETPVPQRETLAAVAGKLDAHLLAYQLEFSGVNNVDFFSSWEEKLHGFNWLDLPIDHIPGSRYAFGVKD